MGNSTFEFDAKHLPPAAFALYQTASYILYQMAKDRGKGPWFDELRLDLEMQIKNMDFPMEIPIDEQPAAVEACLTALRGVFDRVAWR